MEEVQKVVHSLCFLYMLCWSRENSIKASMLSSQPYEQCCTLASFYPTWHSAHGKWNKSLTGNDRQKSCSLENLIKHLNCDKLLPV